MSKLQIWGGVFGLTAVAVSVMFFIAGGEPDAPARQHVEAVEAPAKKESSLLSDTVPAPSGSSASLATPPQPVAPNSAAPTAPAEILSFIEDAATTYQAEELVKIQPYLLHPDPEVRQAARQGIVTLGDAAGGRLLREAALSAPSVEEAQALREAADYVELPSGSLLNAKTPKSK